MIPSPRSQGETTKTNPRDESRTEIDAIDTNENTVHMEKYMRGIIRMTTRTMAVPHTPTARIETNTKVTNLIKTTENTPRLLMARTARVDIMLIMWI